MDRLKKDGRKILLATSKPTLYAKQILERFELTRYFDDVQGSNMDGSRSKKAEVISFALAQNAISDLGEAVMIGDREHDIIGAKECGLDNIGVLFGYGSLQEMQECKADMVAEDVSQLEKLLFQE